MLWVYDNYKYFYSYSAGINFYRRLILSTKVDPRTLRVNPYAAELFFSVFQFPASNDQRTVYIYEK